MHDAILEHWMPERDHATLRDFILTQRRRFDELALGEVESDWVRPADGLPSLDLLVCRSVGPHVDNWHPEWTALWVLAAAPGHVLSIADVKGRSDARIRKPAKALTQSVPLAVGQIVLFNSHRVHWLSPAEDRSPLVVGSFECKTRPSREEIEGRISAMAAALPSESLAA